MKVEMPQFLSIIAGLLVLLWGGCAPPASNGTKPTSISTRSSDDAGTADRYVPASKDAVTPAPSVDMSGEGAPPTAEQFTLTPRKEDSLSLPTNFTPPITGVDDKSQDPLQRARQQFQRGLYTDALISYREYLRAHPDNAIANLEMAIVFNTLNEPARAMPYLDTAIRLSPDFLNAYRERGSTRLKRGELEPALEDYETCRRLGGDRADLLCAMANVKLLQRKYADSVSLTTQALTLDSQFSSALVIRAMAHLMQGQLDEAQADRDSAEKLQANPQDLKLLSEQIEQLRSRSR
jgi:tetratricopeptide (TPR) repeat protein